jgi:hypothetical protein
MTKAVNTTMALDLLKCNSYAIANCKNKLTKSETLVHYDVLNLSNGQEKSNATGCRENT